MDVEQHSEDVKNKIKDKNSTISISSKLKKRIKSHGTMGDSYDVVLNKIMDSYENKQTGCD